MTERGLKNINVFYSTFTNVFLFFFVTFLRFLTFFIIFFWNVFTSIFVLYTWNDLSHRWPALMVLTFPAAYHNRNVIFFSLVYIATLWLIIFFLLLVK